MQAWPKRAACWSPTMPAIGMAAPKTSASVSPTTPQLSHTSGSTWRGTPNSPSNSSSQSPLAISQSRVRDALVASVRCRRPPLSFHMSQESTVPKASSPARARVIPSGTESRIQRSFVAEKYGSSSRPVLRRTSGSHPVRRSSSHASAVRRSCHTMAGATGSPLARSHTMVVSRWLVMPMATTRLSAAAAPGPSSTFVSASRAVSRCVAQISPGSCSTHPGRGKCWVSSR